MILTLLSMFGGGLMRMLPEILAFMNRKADNSHELAMMNKQLELQKSKGADDRETLSMHGDIDQTIALLAAQKTALEGQMQKTGFWLVDALNFLVRPLATYYFLLIYGVHKAALLAVALHSGAGAWAALIQVYDEADRAILSGILAFWFVGRVFDSPKK